MVRHSLSTENPLSAADPLPRSGRAIDPANRRYAASGSAASERVMKVLVVDAERELAESCKSILTLEGYEVTACHRQQDWLDQMARQPFDIVIIDSRSAGADFEHIERCRDANPRPSSSLQPPIPPSRRA